MRIGRSVLVATAMVAALSLPSVAGPAPPPTNILYGFLNANRTLTLAPPGPVYYVPGDYIVRPGVTLTIEPGVSLLFSSPDTLVGGADPSRVELVIQGQLEALATLPDSIRFESATGIPGTWYGVRSEGGGVLHMQDVAIRGALVAVSCNSPGPHFLRNLGVSASQSGVMTGNSTCDIRDCRIVGQGSYPYYTGTGLDVGPYATVAFPDSTDVQATVVAGFSNGVQSLYGAAVRNVIARDNDIGFYVGGCVVNYCTATRNRIGVRMWGGDLLLNSIIAQNGQGVVGSNGSTGDYLDIWSNSSNWQGITLGPNVASFSPFFIDPANNNFRLGSGSVFHNWSNSGGEIGAYGPGAGLPVAVRKTSWARVKAMYK